MIVQIRDLKRGSIQTIEGRVTRITDEDEFILRDASRSIKVEADLEDDRRLPISRGDRLTVIGRLDSDDFELKARRITRANGSLAFDRLRSRPASNGDDILVGGRRNDRLNGGRGDDVIVGRFGKDTLTGGVGRDRFVYESFRDRGDRITDFSPRQDVIDLSQIFASPRYSSSQPFADYVQLRQRGSRTVVRIDPDGDGGINGFRPLVTLNNVRANTLTENNFLI